MSDALIIIVLMAFMAVTGIAIARMHNLFAVVMLTGIFSLLGAAAYVVLDAVDVAFTEAAVGAGVSTVLMLGTLALTRSEEKPASPKNMLAGLAIVSVTGAVLIYGTLDMPHYGDPKAPIHHHVAPRYLEKSGTEVGLPNVVTSVLASYRGYDTLGETFVIFTAAAGVLAILGRVRRPKRRDERAQTTEDTRA
jgi:multicomponent Na+:H+ antiporter subunit B